MTVTRIEMLDKKRCLRRTIIARTRIELLNKEQLFKLVHRRGPNQDLFWITRASRYIECRLRYLYSNRIENDDTLLTLFVGKRIVGMAKVGAKPFNPELLSVHFVSVEDAYQGNHFARQLIEAVYAYAVERNMKVVPTPFSDDGQRLKHIFDELNEKFPQADCGWKHKDL